MDATIRDLDEYDNKFYVRVSGVSHDLSAAEAKYNSSFIVRVSHQKLNLASIVRAKYQLPHIL